MPKTSRRPKPAVVRVCEPNQAAQTEAVRLLMERGVPASKETAPGERRSSNR